jgi:hypothetical protein
MIVAAARVDHGAISAVGPVTNAAVRRVVVQVPVEIGPDNFAVENVHSAVVEKDFVAMNLVNIVRRNRCRKSTSLYCPTTKVSNHLRAKSK